MGISLDLSEASPSPVALAGTPLPWYWAAPLAPWPRVVMTSLGCLGLAGLRALPVLLRPRMEEIALIGPAVLQGLALPVLPSLARKHSTGSP